MKMSIAVLSKFILLLVLMGCGGGQQSGSTEKNPASADDDRRASVLRLSDEDRALLVRAYTSYADSPSHSAAPYPGESDVMAIQSSSFTHHRQELMRHCRNGSFVGESVLPEAKVVLVLFIEPDEISSVVNSAAGMDAVYDYCNRSMLGIHPEAIGEGRDYIAYSKCMEIDEGIYIERGGEYVAQLGCCSELGESSEILELLGRYFIGRRKILDSYIDLVKKSFLNDDELHEAFLWSAMEFVGDG